MYKYEITLGDFTSKLIDILYQNLGLQQLVDAAHEMINRPIIVHDLSFKVLSASCDIGSVVELGEDENGDYYLDDSIVQDIKQNNVINKIRHRGSFDYFKKPSPVEGTLVSLVRINGIETAQIAVYEFSRPFTDSDYQLLQEFSKLVSLELQKNTPIYTDKNYLPSHIFADSLLGKSVDDDTLRKKLHYVKWSKEQSLYLMTITNHDETPLDNNIPIVMKALKNYIPLSNCTIFKSNIIIFLDSSLRRMLLEEKNTEINNFLMANRLCAGLSLRFSQLSGLKKYYDQAMTAIHFAVRNNTPRMLFEECTIYIVSDLIRTNYEMTDLCHPTVLRLLSIDKEKGTDWLLTLKNYLFFTGNPNEAAKKLNIHRNTLFYRINKIKEMTGMSLANEEEICRIYLSIRFLEINQLI